MGDVPRRRLRILFSMRNCWYVRIFESVIRGLASQGHLVHILAEHDPDPVPQWTAAATALAAESPNVTVGYARRSLDDPWLDLRVMTRLGRDYLRFLEPRYRATPILASRARARVPARVARLAERGPAARALLRRVLGMVERAIPEDPEIAAAVTMSDGVQPDVVLVTPLVDLGSDQHDVLRAARARGIPSALCVGSWDHLSSKGVLRDHPDRIFVWNETQQREAVELHDAPPQSIVVTGAAGRRLTAGHRTTAGRRSIEASSAARSGSIRTVRTCSTSARRCSKAVQTKRSSFAGGSLRRVRPCIRSFATPASSSVRTRSARSNGTGRTSRRGRM